MGSGHYYALVLVRIISYYDLSGNRKSRDARSWLEWKLRRAKIIEATGVNAHITAYYCRLFLLIKC